MLEGELDDHLGYEKYEQRGESRSNSRNGHSSKRVTASFGDMDIDVPWDRNSTFEPLLRKVTKTRTVFPTDDSLFKILILAMKDITAKWYGKSHTTGALSSPI